MGNSLCALRIIELLENQETKIAFSWPVTILFYIMYLGIWSPGTAILKNQQGCHLLNAICELTQFIVLYNTVDTKAKSLSKF